MPRCVCGPPVPVSAESFEGVSRLGEPRLSPISFRHAGREVVFDWAAELEKNPSKVQWAAFFSDCEHEVLEVTGGHRVTMTYNLYWTPQGPSLMAGHLDALQPQSLHFFSTLRELLECREVREKGKCLLSILDFHCGHSNLILPLF